MQICQSCVAVFLDQDKHGLRRSTRTRVKRLEWYKNERIIYDRRKSGLSASSCLPVQLDVVPIVLWFLPMTGCICCEQYCTCASAMP